MYMLELSISSKFFLSIRFLIGEPLHVLQSSSLIVQFESLIASGPYFALNFPAIFGASQQLPSLVLRKPLEMLPF